MNQLPGWMKTTKKISDKRKLELDRMCASWATLAPHVAELSRDECLYIMAKELSEKTSPRPELVLRPLYRAIRSDREKMVRELTAIFPGLVRNA